MTMKQIKFLLVALLAIFVTSCTTVESRHQGVIKRWGGEIDTPTTLPAGVHYGLNYLWDEWASLHKLLN